MNGGWGISYEIALRWMPLDLTDKSTLVQVMAWCRQETSHYLSQCWPRSMLPNGVTRPQWVNLKIGHQDSSFGNDHQVDIPYLARVQLRTVTCNNTETKPFFNNPLPFKCQSHPGPLLLTWINQLLPSIKCGMKLFIHSQTSTIVPLKFGNGYVILSHTLFGM